MRDPREGVQRGILIGFGLCFMGFYAAMLTDCSPVRVQSTCGTLITYSAADQKALAAELRAHPDLVEVPRWLGNYVSGRDAVRACRK